jgi:hypothetical protein
MISGRSRARVWRASPSRISTRSDKPAVATFSRACATFVGSNSVLMRQPPPLSLSAAARWSVEIPKEVPNSTNRTRSSRTGEHIQHDPGFAGNREMKVLHAGIERSIIIRIGHHPGAVLI